jgi:hypothetical protein
MPARLHGRTALVTGSTNGIGAAIAGRAPDVLANNAAMLIPPGFPRPRSARTSQFWPAAGGQ